MVNQVTGTGLAFESSLLVRSHGCAIPLQQRFRLLPGYATDDCGACWPTYSGTRSHRMSNA